MKADVLTLKIVIDDKEKAGWIWEMMRQGIMKLEPKTPLPDLGIVMRSVAWGDTVAEQEYVLDRIARYMSRWDREELLEEMGMEETYRGEGLEQLGGLIEIWEKEARKKYGAQVNSKGETEDDQLALSNQGVEVGGGGVSESKADRETGG